jgi:hypothetical protein
LSERSSVQNPMLRYVEQSVYVSGENRERNVQLIDFDHPDNNN